MYGSVNSERKSLVVNPLQYTRCAGASRNATQVGRHGLPVPTKLTRRSICRRDKLSRLSPPSELIERPSSCEIRSLAEGERPAPVLLGQLGYFLSKSSLI